MGITSQRCAIQMIDNVVKNTDVLVVGGGLAGLWAAIRASDFVPRVLLVDKGKVSRSGASIFCHTTLAPVPKESSETWIKEFVERSGFLADQYFIEILVQDNNDRLREMERWGVSFVKDEKGNFKTEAIRGQKVTRAALYSLGLQMMTKMREEALRRGVELVERVMVTDLLTSDGQHPTKGRVTGAVGMHTRSGEFLVFNAGAVIIATGGMSPKLHCVYVDNVTGDGQAMAFRAGADMGGMEFAQNPNFGVWERKFNTGGQQQFLMHGAKIVNSMGERFMERYKAEATAKNPEFDGHIEFGDLCRAMTIEILEGRGPVYFDLRQWSPENIAKMRQVLPATMKAFDSMGIDLRTRLVENTPMVISYGMGGGSGIRISAESQSSLPGLYAAGASSTAGPNIIAQAFCNISGYRAGEYAGKWARKNQLTPVHKLQVEALKTTIFAPLQRSGGVIADELYSKINRLVTPFGASLFKRDNRIRKILDEFQNIKTLHFHELYALDPHELIKANEVRNFLQVLELIYTAAMERQESRFGHYREEYPYKDNKDWLKWVMLRNTGQETIHVRTEPSRCIRPDTPTRVMSPIQYSLSDKIRDKRIKADCGILKQIDFPKDIS